MFSYKVFWRRKLIENFLTANTIYGSFVVFLICQSRDSIAEFIIGSRWIRSCGWGGWWQFFFRGDCLWLFCFDKEIGFFVEGGGFNELLVLLGSLFDLCAAAGWLRGMVTMKKWNSQYENDWRIWWTLKIWKFSIKWRETTIIKKRSVTLNNLVKFRENRVCVRQKLFKRVCGHVQDTILPCNNSMLLTTTEENQLRSYS